MKRIKEIILVSPLLSFLIVFSSCTVNANAQASTNIQTDETSGKKTLSPYFVVLSDHPETDQLPLKETTANVNIVGVIADVSIKQKYVNAGKNTLEAIYTFPLSTRAAVYSMQMKIGDRLIVAKIKEKEKAKKDYEKAKNEGKRVSLLEQNRPNVFTMKVANIAQNDIIEVELKYTELLVPENGNYSFVYPTVVGPRYSNKTVQEATPNNQFVNSPYTKKGELPAYKFNINFKINSGIPIQDISCNTHKVNITHPNIYNANIKLDPSETKGGNRDVVLNYSLQGNKIESGVMLYENGDENFFLMMIQPPKKILKEEIPAREYIFIVDVSGSMNGFPLDISKKLLRNLIVNLKPTDKFNVVLFAGTAGLLNEVSLNANETNIERAIQFIDRQHGGGGTELLKALSKAYSIPRKDENISCSYVLISDGYVDVEKEAFDLIRKNNNNNNFFSFGIGSSVNRYLMEGIAFMGNGEPMIIERSENAEKQAEKFRSYINSPVLCNIKTDFGTINTYDIEPSSTPDMLAERPIVIFGKYKGAANGKVIIKGKTGTGSYSKTIDFAAIKPNPANSAIRYLWARERIKLLDYYDAKYPYSRNDENGTLKNEITSLGLKYNLMTNYTSFIAVDEKYVIDKDGKKVTVKQPLPLPQGVSNKAIGVESLDDIEFDYTNPVIEEEDNVVFTVVETMPSFLGGDGALKKFLEDNITYPPLAKLNGIQGRVIVQFNVDIDGSIQDIKIVRSISPELDAEAIRVVKKMPKWIPGKQRGKAVKVKYTLPITFKLT